MADETRPAEESAAEAAAASAKGAADTAATGTEAAADATAAGARAAESFTERTVEGARRAGEAFKASGEKAAEGRTTIGLKMIEQAEANAREAFDAMRQAAGAKDMTEIMRIQADYLRKQGSRAVDQAREIGELIARFGRETTAPLRPDRKD